MARRVSLFVTCVVDQLSPRVGVAMAEVLERIGYQVDFPEAQTCNPSHRAGSNFLSPSASKNSV
jgi:L-lactate dehydrogenase complex protein LldE